MKDGERRRGAGEERLGVRVRTSDVPDERAEAACGSNEQQRHIRDEWTIVAVVDEQGPRMFIDELIHLFG